LIEPRKGLFKGKRKGEKASTSGGLRHFWYGFQERVSNIMMDLSKSAKEKEKESAS
jgi:hypothetical protein